MVTDDPQGSMVGVTKSDGSKGSEGNSSSGGSLLAGVPQGSLTTFFLLLSTVAYTGWLSTVLAVLSPHGSEKLAVVRILQ